MNTAGQKKVVIIGGGFGGVSVAKRLAKTKGISVTVITKGHFFEYYPALYKLVTGALAIEVSVPYEKIFRNGKIEVIEGEYQSYDKTQKRVRLSDGRTVSYDYLVLAMGSETNYFGIPGIKEFAFSFKSTAEALLLKQHFIDILQKSKDVSNDELVNRFHVTVVGGGPSGVELAGDITTFLRRAAKRYHIDPSFVTIDLIEAMPRVLSMLPVSVSRRAEARLRKLKVNLYTNRNLQAQDIDEIKASGMSMNSGTVIWTAGTKINDGFNTLSLDAKKHVTVRSDFSIPEDDSVFVIGDGAAAKGAGLAQGAIDHGTYVAKAIVVKMYGRTIVPYKGKTMGYIVPIGHYWAVLTYKKLTISGFIPWIIRSAVDFNYFMSIVSPGYVFEVFKQGAKYRRGDY